MWKKEKAQSFIAYVILIATAVAAFLTMKVYLTRVVQEKYRQSLDAWGKGEQYERGATQVTTPIRESTFENPKENCPQLLSKKQALEQQEGVLKERMARLLEEIEKLEERAELFKQYIKDLDIEIQKLIKKGLTAEAEALQQLRPVFDDEADKAQKELKKKTDKYIELQKELEKIKNKLNKATEDYEKQCL